jgi:SAM-dependent methyltransferase
VAGDTTWSLGSYEQVARQLLPVAVATVAQAAPARGERVLDLGCGTGNAALLAAERGALVTGVDPAQRLLDVAAEEAGRRGLTARFLAGDSSSLPLEQGAIDVVLSVFGVIFAEDPDAAACEIARVTRAGGRLVLSAWLPGGPLGEVAAARREALAEVTGRASAGAQFAWHEPAALSSLIAGHGFSLSGMIERRIAFTERSPKAYFEAELRDNPLWVGTRETLTARQLEGLRARVREILEAANEDPDAFKVTSRYVIATATRR